MIRLLELNTTGTWLIRNSGAWLVGFMYGSTIYCNILNIIAVGLMVSEKIFFKCFFFFHHSLDPQGVASLDLRA